MTNLECKILHEGLVDKVFSRLQKTGKYHSLQKHVEYRVKPLNGECDILSTTQNFINYYEIKCSNHPRAYERALEQFKRFKATHPLLHTRFIYVTPVVTKRIYI